MCYYTSNPFHLAMLKVPIQLIMSLIKYLQILKCTQTCNVQALIFTHNISILLFIN